MIFFEEEFDLLDAFIGEGQDPVVIVGAIDPDDAVLGLETEGKVLDERFADAEVAGDTFDGGDVMHLIALHNQAAAGWVRSFADRGLRQSIPSSMSASCAGDMETVPSAAAR
ncbi:hypothetical protein [Mesorhizobium sp.]|uniref:hypothetical protein n=1 Tax=Mesorhizobium sp. TaxID=1871066 RepID=UPI003421E889